MSTQMALPMTVPVPMAAGSLEAYIQTASRFPILSAEDEQELARRFRQQGDLDSARQLVLSCFIPAPLAAS